MSRNAALDVVLILGLAFAGVPADSLAAQSESAEMGKAKADHEMLAAEYDAEADSALAMAEKHARMANRYKAMDTAGKGPKFVDHCEKLVRDYRAAAENSRELAKLHRELAAQSDE